MQASSIPTKFQIPFANGAASSTIRSIPVASQALITPGAASLTDGFPITNFEQPSAGGVFPFGQDFNGILNQITAWTRWMNAGGPVAYDATFQSEIGGYPVGAIVGSATTLGTLWLCIVDNNTTNPDTGGAGWVSLAAAISPYAVATGSTNAWTATLAVPPAALYDGFMVRIEFAATNTSASPTLNLNGFGAKTIYSSDGATALAIGQLPKNAILQWGATVGGWICLNVSTTVAAITANAPLSGTGTPTNPLQWTNPGYIMSVVTQSPIFGNGLPGNPIGFNNPGYLTSVYVTSPMTGNGTPSNPLAANCLPSVGGTITGNLTISTAGTQINFNKTNASFSNYISSQINTKPVWGLNLSNSTTNNVVLDRFNSSGTYVDSPLTISWSTGAFNFLQQPTWNGAPLLTYATTDGVTVHGNGAAGNPLNIAVYADGTTITGSGTPSSPFAANPAQGGTVIAAYSTSGQGTNWNIASVSNIGEGIYHIQFDSQAPSTNYVVVPSVTPGSNADYTGPIYQMTVLTSGNEWGSPSPTVNGFYATMNDPYAQAALASFAVIMA